MSERYVRFWNDLNSEEKDLAIANYAAIREAEEDRPCSLRRAKAMTPLCRGYWLMRDDSGVIVTCDI